MRPRPLVPAVLCLSLAALSCGTARGSGPASNARPSTYRPTQSTTLAPTFSASTAPVPVKGVPAPNLVHRYEVSYPTRDTVVATTTSPTTATTGPPTRVTVPPHVYPPTTNCPESIAALIRSVFVEDAAWAISIAWRESRCQPGARNREGAAGLFQLVPIHDDLYPPVGCSPAQWSDPGCATRAAHLLWLGCGRGPWSPPYYCRRP